MTASSAKSKPPSATRKAAARRDVARRTPRGPIGVPYHASSTRHFPIQLTSMLNVRAHSSRRMPKCFGRVSRGGTISEPIATPRSTGVRAPRSGGSARRFQRTGPLELSKRAAPIRVLGNTIELTTGVAEAKGGFE